MNPIGLFLIAATTLFPAYQLFILPNIPDKLALFSQYLGLAALILMAWGQILSTRMRGIETLFGGLDRVYVLHKWAGIVAMVAILVHDTVDAELDGLGRGNGLNDLAETLGEISLYGLLILVVISVATFVPYHLWKWTHKAMGALFAAGTFHFVFIMKPFDMSDPAGLYTGVFCLAGLLAYLWMLMPETLRPSHGYTISEISKTGGAIAMTLVPTGRGLKAQPGQFGVFRFTGAGKGEPHPFSFSRIDADGSLRVTVKALGDFTSGLGRAVSLGQEVRVQGPFGRFRRPAKRPAVWIAGGIGITPFLTWARALRADDPHVDLFYCIKSRDDAPHLDELTALAEDRGNLSLHLIISGEGNRLTADHVAEIAQCEISAATIAFCGPVPLREALQKGWRRFGVSPRHFHFEEFEFRTGVGLKKLAAWVLNRRNRIASAKSA